MTRPARLTALDGLRGLAALVVVLYHASKIVAPTLEGTAGTVYRVLADSPAKIVFAGTEAVLVFFALSGLVVALPAFRRGFGWRAYFGSRLIRLYLPVWGALLVAAGLIALVPRHPSRVSTGSWLQTATAHEVIVVDDALNALEQYDPLKARLIEMRFFGGLTAEESAEVLGVPVERVRSQLRLAQAWLQRELDRDVGNAT